MLSKEPSIKSNFVDELFFNSARHAFSYLLKKIEFNDDDIILMPSYIGQSIKEGSGVFDPIREFKLNYEFYKLDNNLNVDLEDIKKIYKEKKNLKAIFVIHYFGFPQKNIQSLADFCDKNSIILIEDCAHSFSSKINNINIGNFGDYSIFSIHKSIPTSGGGILKFNKSLNNTSFDSSIKIDDLLAFSQANLKAINKKRIDNYNYYMQNILENKHLSIFHNVLEENVVPLNFPILINDLDRFELYTILTNNSVPVVSLWYQLIEEINILEYPNTWEISKKILNLPIHQDIDIADIDYILDILNKSILKLTQGDKFGSRI